MPLSNDNQDYKNDENKQGQTAAENTSENNKKEGTVGEDTKMTTDDLKGKKVDADPDKETDKPADV